MSNGLKVSAIKKGSQGEKVGVRVGDVISSYNGTPVHSNIELSNTIHSAKENQQDTVNLVVLRGEQELTMNVTTDRLGIDCVETSADKSQSLRHRSADYESNGSVVQSEFKAARSIAQFVSLVGWIVVGFGAFMFVVGMFTALSGDSSWFAVALGSGLGSVLAGLALVLLGQLTRAMVDTADYAREILWVVRDRGVNRFGADTKD